jgi:hypothetical protein
MFCPRCAAQNLDNAKFCRGCGISLESVALALSGQYQPARVSDTEKPKDWLEERHEGIQKIIKATVLLGSSLLIGVALGLLSNSNDWIIIWLIFVGWMASWGIFSLISGVSSLMQARFIRQRIEQASIAPGWPTREIEMTTNELKPSPIAVAQSVTEHTTKSLSDHRRAPKEVN